MFLMESMLMLNVKCRGSSMYGLVLIRMNCYFCEYD